jgi:NuA3 HAT complex component NTO1
MSQADSQDDMRKDTFDDEFGSDDSGTPLPKKQHAAAVIKAAVTTKTARAHAKSYRPGPPVVPHLIVQMLLDYVSKLQIRKRAAFVEKLCRYWSLKREARRGAPLLKRLHLEVSWSACCHDRQEAQLMF